MKTTFSLLFFLFCISQTFWAQIYTDTIYSDVLKDEWYEGAWSESITYNMTGTTYVKSGTSAIGVNFPSGSYFGFDRRAPYWAELYWMYPNQYKNITFYINPACNPSHLDQIALYIEVGDNVKISSYMTGPDANGWYFVNMPIADLNPNNERFFRIYYTSLTTDPVQIFLDDIVLEYVDDADPPVISDVAVSKIDADLATISWKINEPATCVLRYRVEGSGAPYTEIVNDEFGVKGLENLTGLTPSTTYEFEIECADHQINKGTPSNTSTHNGTFTTGPPDVTAPTISNVIIDDVHPTRTVITWETDEVSDTRIDYGTGDYSNNYTINTRTKLHSVVLTGLTPNTEYQYRVASQDKYGNLAEHEETPSMKFSTVAYNTTTPRCLMVYHPAYQWADVPAVNVPWQRISHIIIGALWLVENGGEYTISSDPTGYWGGMTAWTKTAKEYIVAAHNNNRHANCMLGGAGSNNGNIWNTATEEANITTFAENIVNVLQSMGFDGLDIDWENNIEYPKLIRLAEELRKAWPDAIITIPTGMNGSDAVKVAPAKNFVDAFMPMSYASIPQWGGWTLPCPLTPLYKIGANSSSYEVILARYQAAGIPSSQVVMGVGGYGSVWGDANNDGIAPIEPYANASDPFSNPNGEYGDIASDNTVNQKFVNNVVANFPSIEEGWDAIGKCSYWHTPSINQQVDVGLRSNISLIFYETPRSMYEKVNYIEDNNMKGMMFWTLSQLIDGTSSPVLETSSSSMPLDTIGSTVDITDVKDFTGVNSINVIVKPNPTNGHFTVQTSGTNEMLQLELYSISGKLLISESVYNNSGKMIDISSYEKGIYILKLKSRRFSKTQKIIYN